MAKLPVAIDLINAPFWVLAAVSALLWLLAVLLALAGLRDYSLVTSMLSIPAVIHAARARRRSRGGETGVRGYLILGWLFSIVAFLLVWFATGGR